MPRPLGFAASAQDLHQRRVGGGRAGEGAREGGGGGGDGWEGDEAAQEMQRHGGAGGRGDAGLRRGEGGILRYRGKDASLDSGKDVW